MLDFDLGIVFRKELSLMKRRYTDRAEGSKFLSRFVSGSVKVKKMPDGQQVVNVGVGWLARKSKEFDDLYGRQSSKHIKANMSQFKSTGLKSLTRDRAIEEILHKGKNGFDKIMIVKNPYGGSPLCAIALFTTEEECTVRVTVSGRTSDTDMVFEIPKTRYHRVPIIGLYAKTKNRVKFELLDDDKNVICFREIFIKTKKKTPSDVATAIKIEKVSQNPALKNIMISGGLGIRTFTFDRNGDVRHYLRRIVKGYGIFPLLDGHFFFMDKEVSLPSYSNPQCVLAYDMDYMGRVYKTYLSEKGFHHTLEEKTPGGNFLTGSNTMEEHTEDVVAEIDRQTGKVVNELRIDEVLDDTFIDMMDWAHVNSAVYYEQDDAMLISLRNVHAVICVDYKTKKLRWMLSDPEFWKPATDEMKDKLLKPIGEVPWCYQQHAAYFIDEDLDGNPDTRHMIVFDNHWAKRRKAESFDNDKKSYVSIYTINEKEMTVSLEKRFGHRKTRIRANALLCLKERRVYSMAASYAKPDHGQNGAVYEFDYDTGEIVSKFFVKPGYFRAYDFNPCVEKIAKPIEHNPQDDFLCGDLKRPVKMSDEEYAEFKQKKTRRKKIMKNTMYMEEDILFVQTIDHGVKKIVFVGENEAYATHFEETYQTMDVFATNYYYIVTWLDTLPPGRYNIFLDMGKNVCRTRKWIEK